MNILIFGGTGAMGTHLVTILSEIHPLSKIIVTTRKKRASYLNVSYVEGNAHDIIFLNQLLCKVQFDVIVDFMTYKTNEFKERIDLLLSSCKQYIYLSSARVYADSNNTILMENSLRLLDSPNLKKSFLLSDEYALTKARQENILLHSKFSNWIVIRPYITYSEERLQLGVLEKEYWLYRALMGRTIVFSEDIMNHITTITYGKDVSAAIASVLGNLKLNGNTFHITGPSSNAICWKNVLNIYIKAIEQATGKTPHVFFQKKSFRLHLSLTKWQVLYDRIYDRRFDNSKINKYIDISNFVCPSVGLEECIKKFIEHPKFKHINWKEEAYYDSLTDEYAMHSEFSNKKDSFIYKAYRTFPFLIYFDIAISTLKEHLKSVIYRF